MPPLAGAGNAQLYSSGFRLATKFAGTKPDRLACRLAGAGAGWQLFHRNV